jgi:choline dehydrogenase-like flavoprotein
MESILATAWEQRLAGPYDIIVVGSVYGGAITAARLANAPLNPKLKICLLERGQEWPIGSFPDTIEHVVEQTYNPTLNPLGALPSGRSHLDWGSCGERTGWDLFDERQRRHPARARVL